MRATICLLVAIGLSGCSVIEGLTPPKLPYYEAPDTVLWLDQNWSNDARWWFHHAPQGTATIPVPYTWFMALEQPILFKLGQIPLLSDTQYLARLGFIPSPAGSSWETASGTAAQGFDASRAGGYTVDYSYTHYRGNPGGLPVGFALTDGQTDPVTGEALPTMLGLSCAGCHTGHLTYQGTALRIDGGSAASNLDALTKALQVSLAYTKLIPGRFSRFADRVLGDDHDPDQRKALKQRFNALLDSLKDQGGIMAKHQPDNVEEGFARLDALNRIGNQVFFEDIWTYSADGFDPAANIASNDAPVNYPHIWSTSWFDWVQYDASIMQPMVRNAGEALGVAAHVNLVRAENLYASTVLVEDIHAMEQLLAGEDPLPVRRFRGLTAPRWPEAVLGAIDRQRAERGAALYAQHCQDCHLPPVGSPAFWSDEHWVPLPDAEGRYLRLKTIPAAEIGTDPAQAAVLANRKVALPAVLDVPEPEPGPGGVICGGQPGTKTRETPFAWALAFVTQAAVDNRYDALDPPPGPEQRRRLDGNRPNCVRAVEAYKARPLNGIWATAPFLHNGSVLTLQDLLRPAAERPTQICLGDRELDPVGVGLVGACKPGTTRIDTTRPGNLATGHSFESGSGPGIIGPRFTDDERADLIEYLKTL
jgi:mono/diheme cytochrome c family protein